MGKWVGNALHLFFPFLCESVYSVSALFFFFKASFFTTILWQKNIHWRPFKRLFKNLRCSQSDHHRRKHTGSGWKFHRLLLLQQISERASIGACHRPQLANKKTSLRAKSASECSKICEGGGIFALQGLGRWKQKDGIGVKIGHNVTFPKRKHRVYRVGWLCCKNEVGHKMTERQDVGSSWGNNRISSLSPLGETQTMKTSREGKLVIGKINT